MADNKQAVVRMLTEGASNPRAAAVLYLESMKHRKYNIALYFAKSLAKQFPENYNAHHIVIATQIFIKAYSKAGTYLKSLENHFGAHPQYIIDRLWFLVKIEEMEKARQLLLENEGLWSSTSLIYLENAVKVFLFFQDKRNLSQHLKMLEEKQKKEYATLCLACLGIMDGNISEARKKLNVIIESKKNTPEYYLSLSLQPIVMQQDGDPAWGTVAIGNAELLDSSAREKMDNFWHAQLAAALWEIAQKPEKKDLDEQLVAEVMQLIQQA